MPSELTRLFVSRHGDTAWTNLNVPRSGRFSSDRTITEYAESIWGVPPCPVAWPGPSGAGEVS